MVIPGYLLSEPGIPTAMILETLLTLQIHSHIMFDKDEFERWMAQASDTLVSARQDFSVKSYNWCCFKAQQAAEYAVKALLKGLGVSAYGHSIIKLLKDLEVYNLDFEDLKPCARTLDRHYVPARYPDAFTEGSPFEFYDDKTALEAISCAEKICNFCIDNGKEYEGRS